MSLRFLPVTTILGMAALSGCCFNYKPPKGAAEQPQVACSTQVLEGFRTGEACPVSEDYDVEAPFAGLSQDVPQNKPSAIAGAQRLERFCRYFSKAGSIGGKKPSGIALTRTCPAVVTQTSSSASNARWSALKRPDSRGGKRRVTVAVIDTAESASTDVSGHGHVVAAAIQHAACEDTSKCNIDFVFESAMPLTSKQLTIPRGQDHYASGHVGTPSTLAEAIVRVLKVAPSAPDESLVINLSIGWERGYGIGFDAPTDLEDVAYRGDAGAHAAFSALLIAHGMNVPVFAASGNRAGPTAQDLPVFPAGFARFADTSLVEKGLLVTPVTAATFGGRKATLQREQVSAFAAPSVQFDASWGDRHFGPRSGTSIAAAVVTGFAARRLREVPQAAYQLQDVLYDLGTDMVGQVDNASLCSQTWCKPKTKVLGLPTTVTSLPSLGQGDVVEVGTCTNVPKTCEARRYRGNQCPPAGKEGATCGAFCPHLEMNGREVLPWVGPHPPVPICPYCYVTGASFWVDVNPQFEGIGIYPKLTVETAEGTFYFDLAAYGQDELEPAEQDLLNIDLQGATPISAGLSYVNSKTMLSQYEEIPID